MTHAMGNDGRLLCSQFPKITDRWVTQNTAQRAHRGEVLGSVVQCLECCKAVREAANTVTATVPQ